MKGKDSGAALQKRLEAHPESKARKNHAKTLLRTGTDSLSRRFPALAALHGGFGGGPALPGRIGAMTAFQTLSRKASYLREFMRTPREIGSILPSSRYLCREMLAAIDWKSAVSLVELGAAEGVLTARILKRMRPDASLTVYEIRPEFVRVLREIRDPRLTICDHSAEFLSGNHDAIISSLPLVTLPKRVALRVLNASMKAIAGRHGGLFVQYQYSSLAERFLSRFFVWRKTFVLRNVPPAHVYTCRLRPPAAPGSLRSFLG